MFIRPTDSHYTSSKSSVFFTSRSKPDSPSQRRRNPSPSASQRILSPSQRRQNPSPSETQRILSPSQRRRNPSPRRIPQFFSEDVEDDSYDLPLTNDRFFSQQVQRKNHPSVSTCHVSSVIQSPGTKRKFVDADLTNQLINKIDILTDQVMNLNKKDEKSIEEIRRLRKSNDKIEKITYTLAKSQKYDCVVNETIEQLPVVDYNGKNLLVGPLPPLPTNLLCKLIRQLYSNDEIVQGIQEDPRLLSIKKAICAAYYSDDKNLFNDSSNELEVGLQAYNLRSIDIDPELIGNLLTKTSERIVKKLTLESLNNTAANIQTMPNNIHDSAMMICYRECLTNLSKFNSGEEYKIFQFISNIERIGKMIDANENILHCMCTAKFDGEARRWYDDNIVTTCSPVRS
ncbi:unnamed protein product [Rotaria magnacalcarata]|uniref:Uncharacterized protein n=1 Tax=Rotaria magnacalcarata TaxID=392030 RepID=A0A816WAW9_9BILA|nr:unnamed protein product [Rotaria magnacalcarata]